jgi:nitrous oxide reductase
MKRREMLINTALTGVAGIAALAAATQSTPALAQTSAPAAALSTTPGGKPGPGDAEYWGVSVGVQP